VLKKRGMVGYLYAWLTQPAAQRQILSHTHGHTHGGQIDHVTDVRIGSVLVPQLLDTEITRIHRQVMKALRDLEAAMECITTVRDLL